MMRGDRHYAALWRRQPGGFIAAERISRKQQNRSERTMTQLDPAQIFRFRGARALANVTLESGERVLLTIVPAEFAVHRLHLFGMIPGRCC